MHPKLNEILGRIGNGTDVIVYAGPIRETLGNDLFKCCRRREGKRAILFLTTGGGDPHAAFRIARCLQIRYEEGFSILINTFCKSAGTLVAIGAKEIIMSDMAELGPLDVQIPKTNELVAQTSGLELSHALAWIGDYAFSIFEQYFLQIAVRSGGQISTASAIQAATKMAVGFMKPIYEQIDPMRIGEVDRAMKIASDYGIRLNQGNLKEDALDQLISEYPDHNFVIDRGEAKELFRNVRPPSDAEGELAELVQSLVEDALESGDSLIVNLSKNGEDNAANGGEPDNLPEETKQADEAAPEDNVHRDDDEEDL
ncbi:MAG: SppA protein [Deltaproteobacteria bacterium]|jgi:hypothetical protein|nr:SppA protein [Deltaproteobacteria bacterium]